MKPNYYCFTYEQTIRKLNDCLTKLDERRMSVVFLEMIFSFQLSFNLNFGNECIILIIIFFRDNVNIFILFLVFFHSESRKDVLKKHFVRANLKIK